MVRSMTTKTGSHSGARYAMHTGYRQRTGITHPQLGSWAQMFLGKSDPILPSSVVIASGNPGPGFLAPDYSPLPIGNAARGIKDLLPTIDKAKLEKRVRLAQGFSSSFSHYFPHEEVTAYSDFYEQTVKFMSGDMAEPFDIKRANRGTYNRYGNHAFGQGALLARRLVERGVRYAQVTSNRSWDSMHGGSGNLANLANELDGTVSSLMTDLRDRGMLDSTMIVVTSEFGRTPQGQGQRWQGPPPQRVLGYARRRGNQGRNRRGRDRSERQGSLSRIRTQEFARHHCRGTWDDGNENQAPPGTPFLPRRKTQANQGNPRLIVPYDGRFPLPKEIDRKLDRFQNVAGYPQSDLHQSSSEKTSFGAPATSTPIPLPSKIFSKA